MVIGLVAADWPIRFSLDLLAGLFDSEDCDFAAWKLVWTTAALLCFVLAEHGNGQNGYLGS